MPSWDPGVSHVGAAAGQSQGQGTGEGEAESLPSHLQSASSSSLQDLLREKPGLAPEKHIPFSPAQHLLANKQSVLAACRMRDSQEGSKSFKLCSSCPTSPCQCCHRQREGAGGPGPESSGRGAGRAGVGRAAVQAERRWREVRQSGPGHVECPVRGLLAHCR